MTGKLALLALGLAAAAGAAASARAQCRLCETPTTVSEESSNGGSIGIQIDAGLDFDRLILLDAGQGSATLRPDGTSQVSGSIGVIGARAMVGQARVRGEPGRAVRIDLPRRIELHSLRGGRIAIEEIVSDLSDAPRLDSAGMLTFRFGGRLEITGDAEGEYRGDIPITVEYL
jgi:uncharacterized protein DUF4402